VARIALTKEQRIARLEEVLGDNWREVVSDNTHRAEWDDSVDESEPESRFLREWQERTGCALSTAYEWEVHALEYVDEEFEEVLALVRSGALEKATAEALLWEMLGRPEKDRPIIC